ncbi:hypothetical protein Strvi_0045 (plasmid) [Streptomyces violaceusniger Tu 4113]|uniref:Uncharacterized protein n=1 Tax=Streptomyces violaceusniger (strain Tu 4113) TaxID=653045 RepID=G2PHM1_STRV4|nr:hypothetical protein Strvi_0045 [Streptomyces violaceusniger Tu 4113]
MWSQGSRRTGGSPSGREPSFAPKRWPLKPRAKVPEKDPTDPQDEANPALDKSASGGESSGSHGTGRGEDGRDSGSPSEQDVTVRRTEHHSDDHSEPHVSARRDLDGRRGVRGIRSRHRRDPGSDRAEMAADEEPDPGPTASIHTATGISMDSFRPTTFASEDGPQPNLPGTRPLRYVTPSKRSRAGISTARSRQLPGSAPVTSPLPCPGCQSGSS